MYGNIIDGGAFDVVVCGCGSAGFCAAVQAARAGMRTAVVERYGMPGGIMTVGGNNDVAQFYAYHKQIIRGIGWEFILRLNKGGYAPIPDMQREAPHWYYGVRVNIPAAAHTMDVMLAEAGVKIFYGQSAAEVCVSETENGRHVDGVIISTKAGLKKLTAKTVVDCTGDGDVCAFAGAKYEKGDTLQPGTVRFFLRDKGADDETSAKLDALLGEAVSNGRLPADYNFPHTVKRIFSSEGNNINHISGFDGSDSESKTEADIDGRRAVFALLEAMGDEKLINNVCPETAMRETRRVLCDSYITCDDYVAAVDYPDAICYSFYPIDLHRSGRGGIQQVFLTHGRVPRIPLSALTVRGFDNLYVAGRCASGDRLANSAYRVKASCMAMGQAAGAAAAEAVRSGSDSRGCSLENIKRLLARDGAIVPGVNDSHLYIDEEGKSKNEKAE